MGWVVVATTPDGVDPISVLICDGCRKDITYGGGFCPACKEEEGAC